MRLVLPALLAAALTACPAPAPEPPPDAEAPAEAESAPQTAAIDLDDPDTCAGCHTAVVEEWRTSMHAHAHHDKDPVFAGMRTLRMKKQGEAVAGKCALCHTPRSPDDVDAAAAKVGVSCAACHALEGVELGEGRKGAAALTYSADGLLRGPHDITTSAAPHGTGEAAPWLTDGKTVCLACHGAMENPQGAPTCTTGPEHAATGLEQGCTDCHMPTVQGASGPVSTRTEHRSHGFLGGHTLYADPPDPSFMASAVDATLALDGTALTLDLASKAGHHVPSAFPGRMVIVTVEGLDAEGEVVWTNASPDRMKDDPQSLLNTVYVDAEGTPTLPPFAARRARDTRLVHGEPRQLAWTVPDGIASARATLAYRLVPPPAVEVLGLQGRPEAESRPFLTVTTTP